MINILRHMEKPFDGILYTSGQSTIEALLTLCPSGLYPIYINPKTGDFRKNHDISLGTAWPSVFIVFKPVPKDTI